MDTVNERLRFFIEEVVKPKSLRAFDLQIGVAETHTNNIVGKKQNMPNGSYFQKLKEKYPTLSLDWLISGDGDMFKPEPSIDKSNFELNLELLRENEQLKQQVQGLQFGLISAAQSANFKAVNFNFASTGMPVCKIIKVNFTGFTRSCTRMMS